MIWLLIWLVKNLSPIVTEVFIRGGKLIISTAFILQYYFQVPKDVFFILKIPNKWELQQIAFNQSPNIGVQGALSGLRQFLAAESPSK